LPKTAINDTILNNKEEDRKRMKEKKEEMGWRSYFAKATKDRFYFVRWKRTTKDKKYR
jgi:hypothetical protein